jgi:hypothetical protein
MAHEERLVGCDVLDADRTLTPVDLDDFVYEEEGEAVGENFLDFYIAQG